MNLYVEFYQGNDKVKITIYENTLDKCLDTLFTDYDILEYFEEYDYPWFNWVDYINTNELIMKDKEIYLTDIYTDTEIIFHRD